MPLPHPLEMGRGGLEVFSSSRILLSHSLCWAECPGPEEGASGWTVGQWGHRGPAGQSQEGHSLCICSNPPTFSSDSYLSLSKAQSVCLYFVCLYQGWLGARTISSKVQSDIAPLPSPCPSPAPLPCVYHVPCTPVQLLFYCLFYTQQKPGAFRGCLNKLFPPHGSLCPPATASCPGGGRGMAA